MDSVKVFTISIVGVVFLVTILVILYKAYTKLSSKLGADTSLTLGKINTSLYTVIPSAEIVKTKDGL